jgi:mannose-1-phosphate guanylyltransferase/phosphomannomutase
LNSDLGILLDAGAEKVFLADENGTFLDEDRVATVITKLALEARRGQGRPMRKMACPVAASAEMDILAEEYGVTLIRTPNTHGGMMNAVLSDPEIDFVAGTRGGFIFPEFLFATDAMYSVAKILEMMAFTGLRIGEVERGMERLFRASRTVPCPWQAKGRVMRFAMNASENHDRLLIDGIKILFARDTWVLLVPSKEHEIFMVYAEATSQEEADRLASEYEERVVQWRDNA